MDYYHFVAFNHSNDGLCKNFFKTITNTVSYGSSCNKLCPIIWAAGGVAAVVTVGSGATLGTITLPVIATVSYAFILATTGVAIGYMSGWGCAKRLQNYKKASY